jgi:hypothetical protein
MDFTRHDYISQKKLLYKLYGSATIRAARVASPDEQVAFSSTNQQ